MEDMFKKAENAFRNAPHDRNILSVSVRGKIVTLTARHVGTKISFIVSVHERRDDPERDGHFTYDQVAGEEVRGFRRALALAKYHYRRA